MTHKTLVLSAVTAIALLGAGSYALTLPAAAENPPAGVAGNGPDQPNPWHRWGMMHGAGFGPGMHHRWMMAHKGWGLFYNDGDKNLSAADVQVIAQGILLRHGNHNWKVANVVANQDNTVSFAYTTADGGVVARFSIDTKTGQIRRVG